ncbi:transporter family-2 protein [Sedimentibacter acidaminivorans]|uniref:Transporter family-2 protein n=1 Tax=Sedimentibacter acidaminivorans TaxID=913099 RepID=A0ABS4GGL1_9FIRM|nr:DMT family transporter [Sedimentibacter acidaminivorans]MBP1926762.1 transporter family-2 protein [Sedimentibacter acidaminivorans]
MNEIMPYVFAILTGIFTTVEATVNAQLGRIVTPKIATLHSLFVGLLVMLIANILNGTLGQYSKVSNVEFQWLIGGIFGALIIYLMTLTIPKLGVTITLTIVITSQILSSFYIDTFILKQQQLELTKIIGAFLVVMGLYFIMDK